MEVRIKKTHKDAVLPKYAQPGDAGMDLTAVSVEYDAENDVISYNTGLAFEIPEGYVGLLYPRSSVFKKDLQLANSVGVIDSCYRGEVSFKFKVPTSYWSEANEDDFQDRLEVGLFDYFSEAEDKLLNNDGDRVSYTDIYAIGDRIGQIIIMPYPTIEFKEVEELSETTRGEGGYGSTGS